MSVASRSWIKWSLNSNQSQIFYFRMDKQLQSTSSIYKMSKISINSFKYTKNSYTESNVVFFFFQFEGQLLHKVSLFSAKYQHESMQYFQEAQNLDLDRPGTSYSLLLNFLRKLTKFLGFVLRMKGNVYKVKV